MDGHLPYSHVCASAVKYGQSSIAPRFSGGDSIKSTCDRTEAVVMVVKHNGGLFAVNNRTLYNQKEVHGHRYVGGCDDVGRARSAND